MLQKILAIDRGSKRIGLAWMDEENNTPLPLWYLENTSTVYFDMASLIAQYRITTIVYGYPEGNKGVMTKIDKFITWLKFSVPDTVTFHPIDEHYSSTQASNITGDLGSKHISQDTVSAMVILERYLNRPDVPQDQ